VARQKKIVKDIVGKHGGMLVGKGAGALYDQKKFDTPYIHDLLLDRGASPSLSSTTASIRSGSTSRSRMQSSRRSLTRAAHCRITMRWAPSMPPGWNRTSLRRVCT
jgi:hypothetical protein